jgi:hypothetical protein
MCTYFVSFFSVFILFEVASQPPDFFGPSLVRNPGYATGMHECMTDLQLQKNDLNWAI